MKFKFGPIVLEFSDAAIKHPIGTLGIIVIMSVWPVVGAILLSEAGLLR